MITPFSSPQRGSFLSMYVNAVALKNNESVFVPSTGFFSIYGKEEIVNKFQLGFRPLNGVLFYLHYEKHISNQFLSFRPLNGVLFYLLELVEECNNCVSLVFVPSTGFFSIYQCAKQRNKTLHTCFRPLNGVLFYLQNKLDAQRLTLLVFVPSTGFFSIYSER